MTWTLNAKPASTYTKVDKFDPGFILAEDGSFILAEDSTYIIFTTFLQNIYSLVVKTVASWTKTAKT